MSAWRTLDSIPRDGREVIACWTRQGNVRRIVKYDKIHSCWVSKGEVIIGFETNATHWTELPDGP